MTAELNRQRVTAAQEVEALKPLSINEWDLDHLFDGSGRIKVDMPVAIPSKKLANPICKASIEINKLQIRIDELKLERF